MDGSIIAPDDRILVTGAAGFIGSRVVATLLDRGFRNLVCFVRPSSDPARTDELRGRRGVEVVQGNLLSPADCTTATRGVALILHLAAGAGEKSFPDAFLNSVVTTRNLLEAAHREPSLRRFVLVSSFTVYSNRGKPRRRWLDETCPIERRPELRGDPYCFAKVRQEEMVRDYGAQFGIPYTIVRPGAVYGPGASEITGRVGIRTFGVFLHLGGSNPIPFTYVDNCADAIVLAGLRPGVEGEVFNVVDDEVPSSRHFLRLYKRHVGDFRSVYVPHLVSRGLCHLWERYSGWSEEQLPPVFNRGRWHAQWKKTRYSNDRLKTRLGWTPRVRMADGLRRYFQSCHARGRSA